MRQQGAALGLTGIQAHPSFLAGCGILGTPIGAQQRLMRHADIRTTMNMYGDEATEDRRQAREKVVKLR
jgi:integrase